MQPLTASTNTNGKCLGDTSSSRIQSRWVKMQPVVCRDETYDRHQRTDHCDSHLPQSATIHAEFHCQSSEYVDNSRLRFVPDATDGWPG